MKYIRTKDGRIIACGTQSDSGYSKGYIRIQNKPKTLSTNDPIEILAEADTIDELCDDFVSISKYGDTKPVGDVVNWNYVKTKAKYDIEYIYGAIWTEKGLIYVAKMNEKGEMVLL